jgi:hypothetical protein
VQRLLLERLEHQHVERAMELIAVRTRHAVVLILKSANS